VAVSRNIYRTGEYILIVMCTFLAVDLHKYYRLLNAVVTGPKDFPFGVNTTIEIQKLTATSDNTGTFVS